MPRLIVVLLLCLLPGLTATSPPTRSPATHNERQSPRQQVGATYVDTIPGTEVTFTMAIAPGGTFRLGSPENEAGREPDEGPQRRVTLEPFWIGTHEVTHDEFAIFRFRRFDSEATAVAGVRFDVDAVSRPSPP